MFNFEEWCINLKEEAYKSRPLEDFTLIFRTGASEKDVREERVYSDSRLRIFRDMRLADHKIPLGPYMHTAVLQDQGKGGYSLVAMQWGKDNSVSFYVLAHGDENRGPLVRFAHTQAEPGLMQIIDIMRHLSVGIIADDWDENFVVGRYIKEVDYFVPNDISITDALLDWQYKNVCDSGAFCEKLSAEYEERQRNANA